MGEIAVDPIIGVIYPVPERLKDRLFYGGIKVFVKFLPHSSTRLARGSKVIFYASQGAKKLIGEGTVTRVEFLTPDAVISRYRDRLFLSVPEFYDYVRSSPARGASKEVLTLVLKGIRKYPEPMAYCKPITMTGRYLRASEYDSLITR